MCKELFLHPFMLPCNHCLCERCIRSTQANAEIIENFFIVTCPICSKAHCLPFANKIHLRMNYLRARLARRYMRRFGFLKWRFDKSKIPIYCQVCVERRRAVKRCVTCQLNYCNVCLSAYHQDVSTQNHIFTNVSYELWEEKNCLLHPDALLSKYCLDDHELMCDYCMESWHGDHEVVELPLACSKQSAALFSALAKFKKGSCLYFILLFLLDLYLDNLACLTGLSLGLNSPRVQMVAIWWILTTTGEAVQYCDPGIKSWIV